MPGSDDPASPKPVEVVGRGEYGLRAQLGEGLTQFSGGGAAGERSGNRRSRTASEDASEHGRDVGGQDRHAVAGLDAGFLETAHGVETRGVEIAECPLRALGGGDGEIRTL